MDKFIEFHIESPNTSTVNGLMSQLYTRLHRVLVTLKEESIGVSFPRIGVTPGNILRIHGEQPNLEKLLEMKLTEELPKEVTVSEILQVPKNLVHRTFSRKQPSKSQAKFRRLVQREKLTNEDWKAYRAQMFKETLSEPYIHLWSGSTGRLHKRFLKVGEPRPKATIGRFDSFGMSTTTTVPFF